MQPKQRYAVRASDLALGTAVTTSTSHVVAGTFWHGTAHFVARQILLPNPFTCRFLELGWTNWKSGTGSLSSSLVRSMVTGYTSHTISCIIEDFERDSEVALLPPSRPSSRQAIFGSNTGFMTLRRRCCIGCFQSTGTRSQRNPQHMFVPGPCGIVTSQPVQAGHFQFLLIPPYFPRPMCRHHKRKRRRPLLMCKCRDLTYERDDIQRVVG
jgi:hypothetical protein